MLELEKALRPVIRKHGPYYTYIGLALTYGMLASRVLSKVACLKNLEEHFKTARTNYFPPEDYSGMAKSMDFNLQRDALGGIDPIINALLEKYKLEDVVDAVGQCLAAAASRTLKKELRDILQQSFLMHARYGFAAQKEVDGEGEIANFL